MNVPSIVNPKTPTAPGWKRLASPCPILDQQGYPYAIWFHAESGLGCISAVEVAEDLHDVADDKLPHYHLSISAAGERCTSADALWVLAQFDLSDALEDNHVPSGKVRNFWRPVADHLSGRECPCVETEPAISEDRGDYVWRPA